MTVRPHSAAQPVAPVPRIRARRRQDAALDGSHRGFRRGPVSRAMVSRREDRRAVVPGELPEARAGPGIPAVRPGDPGLQVVDHPPDGRSAEVFRRAAVRHRPVADLPVRRRPGAGQARMRRHRDGGLHVGPAGGGAQRQRPAGEVRRAVEAGRVIEAHVGPRVRAFRPFPGRCAEPATAAGRAAPRRDLLAVPDPELAPGQPGTAPAGSGRRESPAASARRGVFDTVPAPAAAAMSFRVRPGP